MQANARSIRNQFISLLLAAALVTGSAAGLSGCAQPQDGAASTGYAFVQDLVARDYDAAYEHIYSFTSDVKNKQDFEDRFRNIYDALEIDDIQLVDRSVTQVTEDEYRLNYTLRMYSELLGVVDYTFSADIVAGPLGYTVLYSPSLILPMLEEGDKVRVQFQEGDRGEIFAKDGTLLAKNDYAETIYLDLDRDPDIEEVKQVLANLYDADPETIQSKYDSAVENERSVQVLLTFPRNTITERENERINEIEGLGVDASSLTEKRYYPLCDNTAHVVGYLGTPTEEEMAADPTIEDTALVGRSGIESAYEETLRGRDGWRIYIEDSRGELRDVLYEDPKNDGSDVYLTLDTTLQNKAYTLLQANCTDDQSGVIVVMDYKTGDVKAMASYPSYDTNLFNPVSEAVWRYYSEDELTPLFSRCTQADYMPGSTFKVFSAVPAIESGTLTEGTELNLHIEHNEKGTDIWNPAADLETIRWEFPSITRVSTPNADDYENALKSSDNIFFAYYALRTGIQPMKAYLDRLGIGDAPDFELPVRASSYGNDSTDYNMHWLAQVGYGIGVSITPLQLASMYTALMNDGDIVNPTIVDKISRTEGSEETIEWENERTIFRTGVMNSRSINMAKQAMRRVIVDGTAYAAQLSDIDGLIAKTGTAQYAGKDREMNWIVCINPNDQCVYLVMVDARTDEGTAPKLAILNGLLRSTTYTGALHQEARPAPTGGTAAWYDTSSTGSSSSSGSEPSSEAPSGTGDGDQTGEPAAPEPGGDSQEPSGGDGEGEGPADPGGSSGDEDGGSEPGAEGEG